VLAAKKSMFAVEWFALLIFLGAHKTKYNFMHTWDELGILAS
jgi:hypothetical protein